MATIGDDRVVVVAAHPDDEVLGAGGLLARPWQHKVVVVLTDGVASRLPADRGVQDQAKAIRRREAEQAAAVLGVSLRCLDLPDQQLDEMASATLADTVRHAIEIERPTIVVTHWTGDLNSDHAVTAEAVLVAVRNMPRVRLVLGMEVPESTSRGLQPFAPGMYACFDEEDIHTKLYAMRCYQSERRDGPHQRSEDSILAHARSRGGEAGYFYAEAFHVYRGIL